MLKDICSNVCLNKNILMLATVGVYILALVSVFWGVQFWTAGILTLILIVFLVKNLFPILQVQIDMYDLHHLQGVNLSSYPLK